MTAAQRRPRVLVAIVIGFLLALVGVGTAPTASAASDADTIASLANDARAAEGLDPLARSSALDAVARGWADKMAAAGTLSHNPDVAEQIPGGWRRVGENVAQGYRTGSAMHQGWMNSSGHRANILGDYTDIGIAFVRSGGTTWGVQVFASYPNGSSARAPQPTAAVTPKATRSTPSTAAPSQPRRSPSRGTSRSDDRPSIATTTPPTTATTATPSTAPTTTEQAAAGTTGDDDGTGAADADGSTVSEAAPGGHPVSTDVAMMGALVVAGACGIALFAGASRSARAAREARHRS